jgi:hypothetical protein
VALIDIGAACGFSVCMQAVILASVHELAFFDAASDTSCVFYDLHCSTRDRCVHVLYLGSIMMLASKRAA